MAKMNKEQRVLLSKMVCTAAIDAFYKKFSKSFKEYKISISLSRHWGNSSDLHYITLNDNYEETCPAVTRVKAKHFKLNNYKSSFKSGHIVSIFNTRAQKEINQVIKARTMVVQQVTAFNNKMETDFLLKTTFDDIVDIQQFVIAFTKDM